VGESIAAGAGLDDVPAEGEAVDDGGAEPWVGECLRPAAEAVVAGDRDGVLFFAFGQDLEEQLGAAAVCGNKVGPVAVLGVAVDRSGASRTVCTTDAGGVTLTQN